MSTHYTSGRYENYLNKDAACVVEVTVHLHPIGEKVLKETRLSMGLKTVAPVGTEMYVQCGNWDRDIKVKSVRLDTARGPQLVSHLDLLIFGVQVGERSEEAFDECVEVLKSDGFLEEYACVLKDDGIDEEYHDHGEGGEP